MSAPRTPWVPLARECRFEFLTILRNIFANANHISDEAPDVLFDAFLISIATPHRGHFVVLDFRLMEQDEHTKSFALLGGIVGQDKMTKEEAAVFRYLPGQATELIQRAEFSTIMEENGIFWPHQREEKPAAPEKFYYASFIKHTDMLVDGTGTTIPTPWNMVTDIHPLRNLLTFNANNGLYKKTLGGMQIRELLELRFYHELTKSEYDEFKDQF